MNPHAPVAISALLLTAAIILVAAVVAISQPMGAWSVQLYR